ncbi:MAG: gliding motility-associated C-terminal domain-containing protein [Bacteroidota bacterium]
MAQTFNGQGNLAVPPTGTVGITTSDVSVSGIGELGGCAEIDNVTIDLVHTWDGDLGIFLQSPSGSILELSSGNGGAGDNYQVTSFSDAAGIFITDGVPPFNGGFRPEGRQTDFNCPCSNAPALGTFTFENTFSGENADGTWQLIINDYVGADVGTLNSWSITFTNTGSGPPANPAALEACGSGGVATFDLTEADNTVNGGSGAPVSWFTDINGNDPINDPTNYVSGNGTVYAVVGTGCASDPVAVTLTVNLAPNASPYPLDGCDDGTGIGTFDLTVIENFVNLSTGNPVSWFTDPNATIPITDPANFQSGEGIVYAVVSNGNCESAPVEITLNLVPTPTIANSSISPDPLSVCGTGATIFVTFSMPEANVAFDVTMEYGNPTSGYQTYVGVNVFDGSTVPFVISETTEFILTSVSVQLNNANCSVTFANPVTVTVTIIAPPDLTLINTPTICTGETTDLSTAVITSSSLPITFHTATPPNINNQLPTPVVSPVATTTYYAFVDGGAGCTAELPVTVTVDQPATPQLATTDVCENETSFDLTTLQDPNFPNGTWSGPGVTGNAFNATGQTGNVTLTYQPSATCTDPGSTTVSILLLGTPVLGSDEICADEGNYDLTQLQDPAFPNGVWSGPGVTGNSFSAFGLSGQVNLTFDADGDCNVNAATIVDIIPNVQPILGSISLCENDPPLDLGTLADPLYPVGIWSGPGVNGNFFSPANQSGLVILNFLANESCASLASTQVEVLPSTTPQLSTADVCEEVTNFDLTTLQDPIFPNGTWSGPGVAGTIFNANGQSGNVSLTFSPSDPCTLPANTSINIQPLQTPLLSSGNVCENETSFDLIQLQDPAFPVGVWSGPGVNGNTFSAVGQSGLVNLVFDPSDDCSLAATTAILINQAPSVSMIVTDCSTNNLTYTVSFNIAGGDPNSYLVNGQPSSATFTSAPINSGVPYDFEITDANGCNPASVSGIFNCDCTTFAGTMDLTNSPFSICNGDIITAAYNNDPVLEGDDVLVFVLHDASGATLGNVLAINTAPVFGFPASGQLGTTYYVSAVAGNGDGTGSFDDGDGCLSVAAGVPVIFYETTASIGDVSASCASECFDLPLLFTGIAPFDFTYEIETADTNSTEIFSTNQTNSTLTICPSDWNVADGTINIAPINISDLNNCNTGLSSLDEIVVEVIPAAQSFLSPTLCNGETITVQGETFSAANPNGTIVIPNGSVQGCDSTIVVQVNVLPPVTGVFAPTLCPGTVLNINGTAYSQLNPSGVEILPNASVNGCDSTAFIALSFDFAIGDDIAPTLCPGESIEVNGTIYDETNPTGTEILQNGSVFGCDSIVDVNLNFHPIANGAFMQTLCAGGNAIVNGTIYNENNPTGTEVLPGASVNGCDSMISVNLTFSDVVSSTLDQILCPGENLTVNGTIYDENNPSGTELLTGASINGCDSLISVNLTFSDVVSSTLDQILCPGENLTVNGTIYDENNPSGTELLTGASINGCDSLISVNLTFNDVPSSTFNQTLCPGESLIVNGTTYDENNPSGTELLTGASINGCDSLINVDLIFNDNATSFINLTFCPGESITVNGTEYDENNVSGVEIIPGGAVTGCDSVISISLNFNDVALNSIEQTLCEGTSITVNGTIYSAMNPTGVETIPNGSVLGCDSVIQVNLDFYPTAIGNFTTTLCAGSSVVVNGTEYNESNPVGTEILTAESVNGCDSLVNISLSFNDAVSFDLVQTLCEGEFLEINGTIYDENNPAGTTVFTGGSAAGCDSIVQVLLTFLPATEFTLSQTLPAGSSIEVNGTVYDQSNPSGVEILNNQAANGCDSIVTVLLDFFSEEINIVAETISPTCEGDADGQIIISAIEGGSAPYLFSLNVVPPTPVNDLPFVLQNLPPGNYELTISDANGLEATTELIVPEATPILLELGDDQEAFLGDDLALAASTNILPTEIVWTPDTFLSCTNCLDPQIEQPTESTTYSLTIVDENGCSANDEISIVIRKNRRVFIPNVFSPNGDGANDEFTVFSDDNVAVVRSMRIFDRWGNQVFENTGFSPNDLSTGWDGRYRGDEMDSAVFTYFTEVEFVDGAIVMYKGSVTLVR